MQTPQNSSNQTYGQPVKHKISANNVRYPPDRRVTYHDTRLCKSTELIVHPHSHAQCLLNLASLRIFNAVVVHNWRRRCVEVKYLQKKVDSLKKEILGVKSQIHVYSRRLKSQQTHNNELSYKLKLAIDANYYDKMSCDNLTTSVISLKADKALLQEELREKTNDVNILSSVYARTKIDLLHKTIEGRKLLAKLSKEQQKSKFFENQKKRFEREMCELNSDNRLMEEKFKKALSRKDLDVQISKMIIKRLESQMDILQQKDHEIKSYEESEIALKNQIAELQYELEVLKESLRHSVGRDVMIYLEKFIDFNRSLLTSIYLFLCLLLPALPLPKKHTNLFLEVKHNATNFL